MTFRLHSTLVGDPAAPHRVVFLHGLFGRGKNFTTIARGLEPEAQSLLVDLPNHGRSEWTERFDYEQLADLVAERLRAGFDAAEPAGSPQIPGRRDASSPERSAPIDVVGHSMGGKVAMVLALRHPDLVRRLVVVDISPVASGSSRGEFTHLLSSLAGLDLDSLEHRTDAHAALRDAISNDTVRGFLLQNLVRTEGGFAWQPNLRLLHDEIETVMGFPDMTGLQFDGPVLWIRGELSDYVTDADAPVMRALFPKVRRTTVKGAGHWVHSQKPDEVIAALRGFLL